MTEVPSMFGVEKKSSWRSLDEWSRSVKAKGIFLGGTKETRVMVGNGDIHHFPLLYLSWLSQWLSSCGSVLVLKDWCQKHTTDLGTNILKKKRRHILRTSRSIYGRLCIAAYFIIFPYPSLPIWEFISLSRWGGIRCGAESGGSPAREAGKQNVNLDWQICYVEQHGHVQVHKTSCFHTQVLPFEVKQTFGLNIWSWSTVHWVVL